MQLLLTIVFFILLIGLCVGSFLNVVILRAFSNESIVFPASKCPKCQHKLKWYHNLPVVSYLFLKGKCAFCGEKISIQYPIIELITGIVFLVIFMKYGVTIQTLFMWYFSSLFIVLSVTDLKEKVIFTTHAYFLIVGCLLFNILNLNPFFHNGYLASTINSVVGLILGIIIMELLARVGYLFAGTRAFGEGDTYIAAALGALFGWHIFVISLILAIAIQLIFTIPLFLFKLIKNKDFITVATFLAFIVSVILCKMTNIPFAISTTFLVLSAGFLCYRILKDLKTGSDMMYLPFGPAMILSAFIIITSVQF